MQGRVSFRNSFKDCPSAAASTSGGASLGKTQKSQSLASLYPLSANLIERLSFVVRLTSGQVILSSWSFDTEPRETRKVLDRPPTFVVPSLRDQVNSPSL